MASPPSSQFQGNCFDIIQLHQNTKYRRAVRAPSPSRHSHPPLGITDNQPPASFPNQKLTSSQKIKARLFILQLVRFLPWTARRETSDYFARPAGTMKRKEREGHGDYCNNNYSKSNDWFQKLQLKLTSKDSLFIVTLGAPAREQGDHSATLTRHSVHCPPSNPSLSHFRSVTAYPHAKNDSGVFLSQGGQCQQRDCIFGARRDVHTTPRSYRLISQIIIIKKEKLIIAKFANGVHSLTQLPEQTLSQVQFGRIKQEKDLLAYQKHAKVFKMKMDEKIESFSLRKQKNFPHLPLALLVGSLTTINGKLMDWRGFGEMPFIIFLKYCPKQKRLGMVREPGMEKCKSRWQEGTWPRKKKNSSEYEKIKIIGWRGWNERLSRGERGS